MNARTVQRSIHTVDIVMCRHNKEVLNREFATICTQRVGNILTLVNTIAKEYAVDNVISAARYNITDAGIQLSQLEVGYATCLLVDIYIVLVAYTIDRTARYTHIGRVQLQVQLRLQRTLCLGDSISKKDEVRNITILHTALDLLHLDTQNGYITTLFSGTYSHSDIRRAYVYAYYVLFVIHI